MRTWATRFPTSSTTAMFMGCPKFSDFFSAAAIIFRASLSVIISVCSIVDQGRFQCIQMVTGRQRSGSRDVCLRHHVIRVNIERQRNSDLDLLMPVYANPELLHSVLCFRCFPTLPLHIVWRIRASVRQS